MKYAPYLDGYSVLPALHKLENQPIFEKDDQADYYLTEKRLAQVTQKVFLEHDINAKVYQVVCDFIVSQVPNLKPPFTFDSIAMQLQEDLAIHRVENNKDWLAACHISFPSRWLPEEKIGKSFQQIHTPVPGMNLENALKMAQSVIHHGPYYRFVWGPIFEKQINFHPSLKRLAFNPNLPIVIIKVERQLVIGFPQINSFLFIIRQHLILPDEIDYTALFNSCNQMNEAQKIYKNVNSELLNYLEKKASEAL